MSQLTTSEHALAAGAATVHRASIEIQGQLDALRCEVETMMGGWRGQAATSFVHVHERFESQATTITTALRRMHEALLATRSTYGSQERNETRTLSGLARQMSG